MDSVVQECIDTMREAMGKPSFEAQCQKLTAKLAEARYDEGSVRVISDCILILLMAAESRGFNVDTVVRDLTRLATDLRGRRWKKMADGTFQVI